MDIFDFKSIECPICKAPMRCVHVSIPMGASMDEDKYTVMYRCNKRHIFQGNFDEEECLKLKGERNG